MWIACRASPETAAAANTCPWGQASTTPQHVDVLDKKCHTGCGFHLTTFSHRRYCAPSDSGERGFVFAAWPHSQRRNEAVQPIRIRVPRDILERAVSAAGPPVGFAVRASLADG